MTQYYCKVCGIKLTAKNCRAVLWWTDNPTVLRGVMKDGEERICNKHFRKPDVEMMEPVPETRGALV